VYNIFLASRIGAGPGRNPGPALPASMDEIGETAERDETVAQKTNKKKKN